MRRSLRPGAGVPVETLEPGLAKLRAELEIPESYAPETLAEAERVAALALDDLPGGPREDLRDVEFVTIDPPGATDLDQALFLSRRDDGYLVQYAIADVGAFVVPGSALDAECHARGLTYYGPDGRFGLHPPVLSEDAASLLPDQDRAAIVWSIGLDARGEITDVAARRALVRSRAQLDYAGVQASLDDGTETGMLTLLPEIGELRTERQLDRGGASLEVPDQEITVDDGHYRLTFRSTLPLEDHNAQISLLTVIAAAQLMRRAGIGIFRTLQPAREQDVDRLRGVAAALGLDWPADQSYGRFVRTLDTAIPAHAAFAEEATGLFRGAAYVDFTDGAPDDAQHSAIAAEYAHVTAPLRRLVDRYGLEIAVAVTAGTDVPHWVREALPGLPKTMARSGSRAGSHERGAVDLTEAITLADRIGERFEGVIVDVVDEAKHRNVADGAGGRGATGTTGSESAENRPDAVEPSRGEVLVPDDAIRAEVVAVGGTSLPLGERVPVTLVVADAEKRSVRFEYER